MRGSVSTYHDIKSNIEERCDVVVIGSGAGGAVCAAELAEAGYDVVLLEEGGYHKTETFSTAAMDGARRLYRNGGTGLVLGNPPIMFSEGRCVGGSTTVNGGMCWRTPDKILQRWGIEHSLTGISAKEMLPYFERVEQRISVAPQDDDSVGKDAWLFEAAAKRLGWKITRNRRNQVRCVGTNNCALGCTSGAKQSTLVSYVPRALHAGIRLYANSRVDKIQIKDGKAQGVEGHVIDADGVRTHKLHVQADVVIVSGGAAQTPALLFRSGFFWKNRNVGKHLMLHPNAKTVGIFDEELTAWQGVHQNFQVHEFLGEGLIMATGMVPPNIIAASMDAWGNAGGMLMQNFNRMLIVGVLIEDTGYGRIFPGPRGNPLPTYSINQHDFHTALRGMALAAQVQFEAGAKRVLLPFSRLHELRSPDEIPKIFAHKPKPADLELFTVHLMGSCRMSADRSEGVINSVGESHDVKNLFVADASIFPSSIGLNPMESIMAFATRTSAHIVENGVRYFSRKQNTGKTLFA